MPKLNFTVQSAHQKDVTFEKIQIFLKNDNPFKKFDPKINSTFDESKKTLKIDGSQFKATILVTGLTTPNAALSNKESSQIEIQLEYPFLLSAFKNKIEEEVTKAIHKVLA